MNGGQYRRFKHSEKARTWNNSLKLLPTELSERSTGSETNISSVLTDLTHVTTAYEVSAVEYEGPKKILSVVVTWKQPHLLWRHCLAHLMINWGHVFNVAAERKMTVLLKMHRDVFTFQVLSNKGYMKLSLYRKYSPSQDRHLRTCPAEPLGHTVHWLEALAQGGTVRRP